MMKTMRRWVVLGLVVAGVGVMTCGAICWADGGGKAKASGGQNWQHLFSDGLMDANGNAVSLDKLDGKLVAVYFSAHWCPPCRAFTPKLVAFRDKHADDFEVVFVSLDRTQADKDKYISETHMKWLTVPFRKKSTNALAKKFKVRGIPTLVVLSPKGNTVSTSARMEVTRNPGKCIATWKKTAAELDKK